MRKKNLLLLALLLGSAVSVNAQKGKVKLDFAGGFEMAEKEKGEVNGMNGFNVNADFKYYVNNRLYTLGTVFTSKVSELRMACTQLIVSRALKVIHIIK